MPDDPHYNVVFTFTHLPSAKGFLARIEEEDGIEGIVVDADTGLPVEDDEDADAPPLPRWQITVEVRGLAGKAFATALEEQGFDIVSIKRAEED